MRRYECITITRWEHHDDRVDFLDYCIEHGPLEEERYYSVSDGFFDKFLRFITKYYPLIYKLTDIMIRDLEGLRGTHSWKNRTIARLKKFIRVMENITGWMGAWPVSLYELYKEDLDELQDIIKAMESVKDNFHSVRDPVHELFYPYIMRILKHMPEIEIRYYPQKNCGDSIYYVVNIDKDQVEVKRVIKTKHTTLYKKVSINEIKSIIEKHSERRRRHVRIAQLWRYVDKCLENPCWEDPLAEYYTGIPMIMPPETQIHETHRENRRNKTSTIMKITGESDGEAYIIV